MNDKLCPLKFAGQMFHYENYAGEIREPIPLEEVYNCEKHKCAWWVYPYTTEHLPTEGMRAIELLVMRTSEGLYRA